MSEAKGRRLPAMPSCLTSLAIQGSEERARVFGPKAIVEMEGIGKDRLGEGFLGIGE